MVGIWGVGVVVVIDFYVVCNVLIVEVDIIECVGIIVVVGWRVGDVLIVGLIDTKDVGVGVGVWTFY